MENKLETALVTIEQASTRWCPEGRTYEAFNERPYTTNDGSTCIGERCMFWRWHDAAPRERGVDIRFNGTLAHEEHPSGGESGRWVVVVPDLDDGDGGGWFEGPEAWQQAREAVTAGLRPPVHPTALEASMEAVFAATAIEYRYMLDPLPPRGYCGKAGHPLAARLHEAEAELALLKIEALRRAAGR